MLNHDLWPSWSHGNPFLSCCEPVAHPGNYRKFKWCSLSLLFFSVSPSLSVGLSRMVEYSLDLQNINLSAIRTVRVLRPLKAINRVPSENILLSCDCIFCEFVLVPIVSLCAYLCLSVHIKHRCICMEIHVYVLHLWLFCAPACHLFPVGIIKHSSYA